MDPDPSRVGDSTANVFIGNGNPLQANVVNVYTGDQRQRPLSAADGDLRKYLDAMAGADRRHEYATILDGGPPLGDVYLERTAEQVDGEDTKHWRAEKLLQDYAGIQVTGEPGVGKSSLLRRIAAIAARAWTDGRDPGYVPVLIAANDLRPGRALEQAMVAGTLAKTAQILDERRLAALFERPPMPGVRWLVLVDGLDEVVGLGDQSKILLAVEQHRARADYRLVVAGRGGFAQVADKRHPTFRILPFTEAKWIEFAASWLGQRQGLSADDAQAAARDLLRRVGQTKIGTLTWIPLIASMICLLHVNAPALVPDNQSELYREFVDLLLSQFAKSEIGKQLAGRPLLDEIEVVLEELAYAHQTQGPAPTTSALIDRAVAVAPPPDVSLREWRDLLVKVLRGTGLITLTKEDDKDEPPDFLHSTIAEYLMARRLYRHRGRFPWLTARRAFAPRPVWERRDVNVRVFLAARWLEQGHNLDRPLLRLLRPRHRNNNAGFIVELVKHGVVVSHHVRTRTKAVLRSMVMNPRLASPVWRDAVDWLDHLDRPMLVDLLVSLATTDKPNRQTRRFEAIRALLPLDSDRGVDLAERFLSSPAVADVQVRLLAHGIAEHAPVASLPMLTRLREHVDEVLLIELMVDIHPAEGMKLLVEEVSLGDPTSAPWRRLLDLLDHHAPELAVDGWVTLVRTAPTSVIREEALERLGATAPDRIAKIATDGTASPAAQVEAAMYGIRHQTLDPAVLHDLATGLTDARWSAQAYAAWGVRLGDDAKSEAADAIRGIHRKLPDTSENRFEVLHSLGKVDRGEARRLLAEEIIAGAFSVQLRLARLNAFKGLATKQQFAEVCRDLATEDRTGPSDALQAAKLADEADRGVGVHALEKVIEKWPDAVGISAARAMRANSRRQAADQFLWLSSNSRIGDPQRLTAADEALSLNTALGRQAFRQLAGDSSLQPAVQLKVAKRMLRFDRAAAQLLLREIVDGRAAGHSVRQQAQALLDK